MTRLEQRGAVAFACMAAAMVVILLIVAWEYLFSRTCRHCGSCIALRAWRCLGLTAPPCIRQRLFGIAVQASHE
jgi:hypothetical protein